MSLPPGMTVTKIYDVSRNDYVLMFETAGKVVLEIRAEDLAEIDTTDGRGIRICIDGVEMPMDWFRQTVNTYMPWLTGEQR